MRQVLCREVLRMLHMPKERDHQLAPWYTENNVIFYNRDCETARQVLFRVQLSSVQC